MARTFGIPLQFWKWQNKINGRKNCKEPLVYHLKLCVRTAKINGIHNCKEPLVYHLRFLILYSKLKVNLNCSQAYQAKWTKSKQKIVMMPRASLFWLFLHWPAKTSTHVHKYNHSENNMCFMILHDMYNVFQLLSVSDCSTSSSLLKIAPSTAVLFERTPS